MNFSRAPPHHSSPSPTPRYWQQEFHGTRIVSHPRVPSRGIVSRRVNPLGRRHNVNVRPRHVELDTIQQLPSQAAGFDALTQSLIHPAVDPQAFGAPEGPYRLLVEPSATLTAGSRPAVHGGGESWSLVEPSAVPRISPQVASFDAFPQPDVHPAVAPPPTLINTFDGTYTHNSYPSAFVPTVSSSAVVDGVTQAFLADVENIPTGIPIPTTSGPAPVMTLTPAPASSPSLTWTNNPVAPLSGSLTGALTPVVRPFGAEEGSLLGNAAADVTTSVAAEPRQVPASCCPYCQRQYPLVRVHDTIEWIRPGVMKMVSYFNWTSNAEAEAHDCWDPRGE